MELLPDNVELRWRLVEDCLLEDEDARERDDELERELLEWELERDDREALLPLLDRPEFRASAASIGASASNVAITVRRILVLNILAPVLRKWLFGTGLPSGNPCSAKRSSRASVTGKSENVSKKRQPWLKRSRRRLRVDALTWE